VPRNCKDKDPADIIPATSPFRTGAEQLGGAGEVGNEPVCEAAAFLVAHLQAVLGAAGENVLGRPSPFAGAQIGR
jgi:hypothetical protein